MYTKKREIIKQYDELLGGHLLKEGSSKFWKDISIPLLRHAESSPQGKKLAIQKLKEYLPHAGENKDVVERAIKGFQTIKTAGTKPQWVFDAIARGDTDLLQRAAKKAGKKKNPTRKEKLKVQELVQRLGVPHHKNFSPIKAKSKAYPLVTGEYLQNNFTKKDLQDLEDYLNLNTTKHFLNEI